MTRIALKLIDRFGFGICIDTKSDLVCRNVDILLEKKHSPTIVEFTITTADDKLSQKIESYVNPTSARLAAIKKLTQAGIMCGVLLISILPFINDTKDNIIQIVSMANKAGQARSMQVILINMVLVLPWSKSEDLFF